MTTAEQIAAIKLGSNVTYVDNDGVEHGAIAKGIVTKGWHAGFRAYVATLNLVYLDDSAAVVQVNSAPLVSEAQDQAFIDEAADFMAKRDAFGAKGSGEMHEDTRDAHLERLTTQPFRIGWNLVQARQSTAKYGKGGDYSQPGDPYGITAEMTAQSAARDVRGNSKIAPRSVPTQEEADAIATCIPKSLVRERQIHPDAVMVEWRPETQDLVEHSAALEYLPTEHQNESTNAPPSSPST